MKLAIVEADFACPVYLLDIRDQSILSFPCVKNLV